MLSYWDDLDADFRTFYRIDGIGEFEFGNLSSARFFALAERTVCYAGAIRVALLQELAESEDPEGGDSEEPEPDGDDLIAASLNMESL